jgi:hypothetical protein
LQEENNYENRINHIIFSIVVGGLWQQVSPIGQTDNSNLSALLGVVFTLRHFGGKSPDLRVE